MKMNPSIFLVVSYFQYVGCALSSQRVYIQHHTTAEYLYKIMPDLDSFTYCMWLSLESGLRHIFPLSIYSSGSHEFEFGWENLHQTSKVAGLFSGYGPQMVVPLNDTMLAMIEDGWHKHCFVYEYDTHFKWYFDKDEPGKLVEMLSFDCTSAGGQYIVNGSALTLLQEQDSFMGSFHIHQVGAGQMAMFNMWNRSMSLAELEQLGCNDHGDVISMSDLNEEGDLTYTTDMFPCPDIDGSSQCKRSVGLCKMEGKSLRAEPYEIVSDMESSVKCGIMCSIRTWCKSADFRIGQPGACDLYGLSTADYNIRMEDASGVIHLSSAGCS